MYRLIPGSLSLGQKTIYHSNVNCITGYSVFLGDHTDAKRGTMKYKVGDKVRIIANQSWHGFKIGDEVMVISWNHKRNDYRCIIPYDDPQQRSWCINECDLSPITDYPKWMEVRDGFYDDFKRRYVIGEFMGRYICAHYENYLNDTTWVSFKEARDIEEEEPEKTIPWQEALQRVFNECVDDGSKIDFSKEENIS